MNQKQGLTDIIYLTSIGDASCLQEACSIFSLDPEATLKI